MEDLPFKPPRLGPLIVHIRDPIGAAVMLLCDWRCAGRLSHCLLCFVYVCKCCEPY